MNSPTSENTCSMSCSSSFRRYGDLPFASVVVPFVGKTMFHGFQAAEPVVQTASQKVGEAASPYVQEAATQISTVTAPYVDQVSSAVDATVVKPIASAGNSVSASVTGAVTAAGNSVTDAVSETIEGATSSVNEVIGSTIVTPLHKALLKQFRRLSIRTLLLILRFVLGFGFQCTLCTHRLDLTSNSTRSSSSFHFRASASKYRTYHT